MSKIQTKTEQTVEVSRTALQAVRQALIDLYEVVGADPETPQEVSRRFSINRNLTWKLSRVISASDPAAALAHLPGNSGMELAIEAFARHGAPGEAVGGVREAMRRLDEVVREHAGDRGTFAVMLGGTSSSPDQKQGEASRKMFYQGASAIWGVQARVHVSLHFVSPSVKGEDRLDLAVVAGFVDFRRLREDVSWAVASMATFVDDGTPQDHPDIGPLDPALRRGEAPLLRQFCSTPVPELRRTQRAGSTVTRYELTEGPVGNAAAATCMLGWVARGEVNRYRAEGDHYGEHIVRLSTPVEVVYHELFVHRTLAFAMRPTVHLYSDLPGGPQFQFDGKDRGVLPVAEEVVDLGESPPNTANAEIPNYRRLVDTAVAGLGRELNDFHGFRFKMKYPPIPAQLLYRYELPEAGMGG
jgi:hypothetical protein